MGPTLGPRHALVRKLFPRPNPSLSTTKEYPYGLAMDRNGEVTRGASLVVAVVVVERVALVPG